MSLALSILLHESKRYLAAWIALALSGTLVLGQICLMSGIGKAATAIVDGSRADLIVLPPGARSFADGGALPERLRPLLYLHPDVIKIQDLDGRKAAFATLDGSHVREQVHVMGIDLGADSLTMPLKFPESARMALRQPYNAAIDRSALSRLGVSVGDRATLNGRLIRIGAVVSVNPSVLSPTVFVSRDTLRLLGLDSRPDRVGTLLLRIRDPQAATKVAAELNLLASGRLRVWTKEDLARANQRQFMTQQVVGLTIGFSAILGLIIGMGVTSQSMRAALIAEIPSFAAFRAVGVSMASLRWIVLQIALWIFMAACAAIAVAVLVLDSLAGLYSVPFNWTVPASTAVALLLLTIAAFSAVSTLRVLKLAEPMDLLR